MLMRTDPFRELDRLAQQLMVPGTWSKPSAMPMDAYREGDEYVVAFDLPGVTADAIDIDVERNMLTVKAERRPVAKADDVQMELSERPLGIFSRQIVLADTLDTEHIQADYDSRRAHCAHPDRRARQAPQDLHWRRLRQQGDHAADTCRRRRRTGLLISPSCPVLRTP